eukprot:617696-Prorocentrum_minimum.AAC.2
MRARLGFAVRQRERITSTRKGAKHCSRVTASTRGLGDPLSRHPTTPLVVRFRTGTAITYDACLVLEIASPAECVAVSYAVSTTTVFINS